MFKFTFFTLLGAIIKCKQCNGITVESGTSVKSVNITLKIFAVFALVETVMFALVETMNETSAPTISKS